MSQALRFVMTFACLIGLAATLQALSAIELHVIKPFTEVLTTIAATLIRLCGGNANAAGEILSIGSGCGRVRVENGCNALEASTLLGAAIIAFPAPVIRRVIGSIAVVSFLQMVNILRIISLVYLSCYSRAWFDFFHLYLWDALIMLDGIVMFFAWYRWQIGASTGNEAVGTASF